MFFRRIFLAILLVAAFPLFLVAENTEPTQYHSCLTFYAGQGDALESTGNWLNNYWAGEEDQACYTLPEKIDPELPILGWTFTDGNQLYGMLMLILKEDEISTKESLQQDENFKNQIRANTVLGGLFSDMGMNIHLMDEMVLVFSDNFTERDEAQIQPLTKLMYEHLDTLATECFIGYIEHYPGWKFLDNLPPESEEDGLFRKTIREDPDRFISEKNNGLKAKLYGLSWDDKQTMKFYMEYIAEEGTPCAKRYQTWNTEKPFQLGGFCSDKSSFQLAYRFDRGYFYPDVTKHPKLVLRSGITIIPPEERDEISRSIYHLALGFMLPPDFSPDDLEENEKIVFETDHAVFTIPKQSDDLPEEEGVPSTEMMDRINVEFAESFQPLLSEISAFLENYLKIEGESLDFVLSQENDLSLFACTLPKGKIPFERASLTKVPEGFRTMAAQTPNPYKDPQEEIRPEVLDFEITNNAETWNDFHFMEIAFTSLDEKRVAVLGIHPEMLCMAISNPFGSADSPSELSSEEFATITTLLKEKIETSRHLAENNAPIPETLCSWSTGEGSVSLTNKTGDFSTKYVMKLTMSAMPQVMTIARMVLPMIQ